MMIRFAYAATAVVLLHAAAIAQTPAKPNDQQIAHVVYTAGKIDIEAARAAIARSKNQAVVDFAKEMVNDHEAVNLQAMALVKKFDLTPIDNDTSRSLTTAATAKSAELAKLDGAAFDKAYMANEVAYHRQVVDALRATLAPAAANPELKDLLQTGAKLFEGHLQHAERVAAGLR